MNCLPDWTAVAVAAFVGLLFYVQYHTLNGEVQSLKSARDFLSNRVTQLERELADR